MRPGPRQRIRTRLSRRWCGPGSHTKFGLLPSLFENFPRSRSTRVQAVFAIMELLFVATILSVVTNKLRMPFWLPLVGVGCAIGIGLQAIPALKPLGTVHLSNDLLTYILLPTLV